MIPDRPSPYDILYSERARAAVARLSEEERVLFPVAEGLLLEDPTPANPRVADVSSLDEYSNGEHVFVFGELTFIYRFLNQLVIEVDSVWVIRDDEPDG